MRNEDKSETKYVGIGFFGLLGILFIALKLIGIINWPWIWVLAPLWAPTALVVGFLIILLIVGLIEALRDRN